jgi:L-fucose isomerase-like protein
MNRNTHMPRCFVGQRTTCGGQFFPNITWSPGTKLLSSSVAASAFTHCAILLAHTVHFHICTNVKAAMLYPSASRCPEAGKFNSAIEHRSDSVTLTGLA